MAKHQKPQKIKLDLLDRNLFVHLLEDSDQIDQLGEKLQLDYESQGEIEGLFLVDDDGESHILFRKDLLDHKIIVHECFHATHSILEDVGHRFDENNHEIYALLMEYLFDKVEQLFYGPSPRFQLQ